MYFLHYTPCIESKNIMLREFLAADVQRIIGIRPIRALSRDYEKVQTFKEVKRVRGQVPDSLLSWNCRRAATSGYPCVTLGAIAKVMRNEE